MDYKQLKIKEVYEGYVGAIDENGWTNWGAIQHFGIDNLDCRSPKKQMVQYRPKVLSGIENNNGWIETDWGSKQIEFGKMYHFIPNNDFNKRFIGFINNEKGDVCCFNSLINADEHGNFVQLNSYPRESITHYQEIPETHKNVY